MRANFSQTLSDTYYITMSLITKNISNIEMFIKRDAFVWLVSIGIYIYFLNSDPSERYEQTIVALKKNISMCIHGNSSKERICNWQNIFPKYLNSSAQIRAKKPIGARFNFL